MQDQLQLIQFVCSNSTDSHSFSSLKSSSFNSNSVLIERIATTLSLALAED